MILLLLKETFVSRNFHCLLEPRPHVLVIRQSEYQYDEFVFALKLGLVSLLINFLKFLVSPKPTKTINGVFFT